MPEDADPYGPAVYQAAADNFRALTDGGAFFQDSQACLYLYELTGNGHSMTGVVAAASVRDYQEERIKKHELTRPDKQTDRVNHIRATMLNTESVMLAYRARPEVDELAQAVQSARPEYDFSDDDGVRHRLWVIRDEATIVALVAAFDKIPVAYVADGHHRSAAAAVVSRTLNRTRRSGADAADTATAAAAPAHDYFLATLFPDNQLRILDYNRVVADLNGLDEATLLRELGASFAIEKTGQRGVRPTQPQETGMYLAGDWFRLTLRRDKYQADDEIASLGVSVLADHALLPLLGIRDPRTDRRIAFVGGARGLEELERRVDNGEMAVAFSLCPITMRQLMTIADSGRIMPPKATWFEPKLRSGLVVYSLRDR